MTGPPAATHQPLCPKCHRNDAVTYLGESRAFQARGKPPVKVFGCRRCPEEFAPRSEADHPKLITDGVPPVRVSS
jgi:hypothetical protein